MDQGAREPLSALRPPSSWNFCCAAVASDGPATLGAATTSRTHAKKEDKNGVCQRHDKTPMSRLLCPYSVVFCAWRAWVRIKAWLRGHFASLLRPSGWSSASGCGG